jgi:hypothetical protein
MRRERSRKGRANSSVTSRNGIARLPTASHLPGKYVSSWKSHM